MSRVETRRFDFFFLFNNENLVYWILSWIENSKTIEIETNLFLFFFRCFDLRNEMGPATRVVRAHNTFQRLRKRWNTLETTMKKKKEKVGKICWSSASLLPLMSFRARFEERIQVHSTRNRFVQTLLPSPPTSPPLGEKLERELFREWERNRFENVAQGMGPAWMRNQLEKNGSKREEGVVEWRAGRGEVR